VNGDYLPPNERRPAIERVTGGSPTRMFGQDPGFQPPFDLLDDGSKFRVEKVYRDVPLVTVQTSWTVPQIRYALAQHMQGIFDSSAQLVDAMLGDDRVQATMGSRLAGLFGREIRIRAPRGLEDSRAYKECEDGWYASAEELLTGWALQETAAYTTFMGFGHGQLVWDASSFPWRPIPRPWHPRYEWFDWLSRQYVAISQDGNLPILCGDGKWYGHLPYGTYRSWIRGTVRPVAEPWIIRHFAIRDWARFSEVHGLPTRVGYTPAAADPGERSQFERQLSRLGSDTTLLIPRGVDKDMGYGYELVEAGDTAWESFPGLRDHCDLAIVLSIKFQNLTTEITSNGSLAAAKEHGKGDVAQVSADNRAWRNTIWRDFARPFAFVNYGDARLAPITDFDVPDPPREDFAANADAFAKLSAALAQLAAAGFRFEDVPEFEAFARIQFGVRLPKSFSIGSPPAATTADAAASTAEATHKTADAAVEAAKTNKEPTNDQP
jgi:Protein of unknown function (DUF935)